MGRKGRGYPTVEFRLTLFQRLSPLIGGVIGIGIGSLVSWIVWGAFEADFGLQMLAEYTCLTAVASPLITRSFGVTLTPWTAEVGNLRRRVIWWPDVRMIRVEKRPFFGSRTIVIYEFSGRRTRLRVPATGFLFWDRHFEEKYHAVGDWWLEHRMIRPGGDGPQDALPTGLPVDDVVPLPVSDRPPGQAGR